MAAWLAEVRSSTIEELAERFEMPPEAVRDDLTLLSMTAVGPDGGDFLNVAVEEDGEVVFFDSDLFTRPLQFTAEDALAVVVAGKALLAGGGVEEAPGLAAAIDKVERALGESENLSVEVPAPPHLGALRQAAKDSTTVRIRYYSAHSGRTGDREVDPVMVYQFDGNWYVRGRDHASGDADRPFRVDRVQSVEPTGRRFERPDVLTPVSAFTRSPETIDVTLRIPPTGRWVLETFDPVSFAEDADGGGVVVLAVTGELWLAELLVRLGPEASVLDPPDLADAGRRFAQRLLDRYRD